MKRNNNWLTSLSILAAALLFGALPLWAQVGSESEKPAGTVEKQKPAGAVGIEREKGGMQQGQKGAQEGKESAKAQGSDEIKKVQEALKDKGHNPGPIDGIMGPKTSSALKDFQKAQSLNATGTLDDQTKKALGVGKGGIASKVGKALKSEGGASGASKPEGGAAGGKAGTKEDSQKQE